MFWNSVKTTLLLGALTGILLAFGAAFGGRAGLLAMLVISAGMNLFTWFFSDRIVLMTTGARPIEEDPRLGWLRDDVSDLATRAGIPTPRLYLMDTPSPNAFATGRSPSRGVVAVTTGLLQTLDRREIRGVLAHEIGHIAHRDTLISAVAATIAGVITYLAYMAQFAAFGRQRDEEGANPIVLLLLAVLAPIAAMVVRMAVSRTREYAADRRAALLTGDPEGLASALEGLAHGVQRRPMANDGAQSVHFIVNGFSGGLSGLFSTHPPIAARIAALRELAEERVRESGRR
jgi:heat shock protein HtpX